MKLEEFKVTDGDNNPLDGDVKLYQYEDGNPTKITKEKIKNGKNFYICVPTDKNVTSINVSMKTEKTEMSTGATAEFLLIEPEDPEDKEYQNFIMAKGGYDKKKQVLSTTFSASKSSKDAFIVKRDSMNDEPLKGAKFIIVEFGCLGKYTDVQNKEEQGSYVHIDSFKDGYWNNYTNMARFSQYIGDYVYIGSKNMEEFKTNYATNGDFDVYKKWQIYHDNGKEEEQKDGSITWTDIKNNPSAYQKYIYETNKEGKIVIKGIEANVRYYVMEIEAPPGYTIDHPNEWSKPILTDSDKKISYGYEWDGVITNSCKR